MPRAEAEADGFHALNVPFHDVRHRHLWRFWYHDMYQRIGNEFKFSPGVGTDLWAYLSNDVPTAYLVVAYFVFELVFIGAFGVLLLVTSGIDPGGFMRCVLASARAVTMLANWGSNQFDFVDGGTAEKLSVLGALILMVEGFLHFMFVCVASSLIIVRALRPLQQVAFSHHCCLTDEELVVRIRILRPTKTVLIRPEVKLDVCLTSGTFVKLQIVRVLSPSYQYLSQNSPTYVLLPAVFDQVGDGSYAKWSGNPTITIRHKVVEGSPFFLEREEASGGSEEGPGKVRSTLDGIAHLSCSLVATDANGIPIAEVQQYSPMVGFMKMVMDPYFESDAAIREQYPQILHHVKFQDQIKFGIASTEELARTPDRPWHPHGSVRNFKLRRKKNKQFWSWRRIPGTGTEEIEAKRLVTDTDNFCRLVVAESAIGRSSTSHSTVAEGSGKLEEKHAG
jgi:hypothetical protein